MIFSLKDCLVEIVLPKRVYVRRPAVGKDLGREAGPDQRKSRLKRAGSGKRKERASCGDPADSQGCGDPLEFRIPDYYNKTLRAYAVGKRSTAACPKKLNLGAEISEAQLPKSWLCRRRHHFRASCHRD